METFKTCERIPLSIWKWCLYLVLRSCFFMISFNINLLLFILQPPSNLCSVGVEISLHFPCVCALLLCFHSMLSAYEAKLIWWWEENSGNHRGPDLAPDKDRLALRLPLILISAFKPLCLTHTHTNTHTLTHTTPEITPLVQTLHAFTHTHCNLDFLTIVVKQADKKEDLLLHRHPPSSTFISCVCMGAE